MSPDPFSSNDPLEAERGAERGEEPDLGRPDGAEARRMRWAVAAAVLFHVAFLAVKLPERASAAGVPAPKPRLYVVREVRFASPLQAPGLLEPRAKRLPIVEPTPDAPEPIRIVHEVEQRLPLRLDDSAFGIPEAPPRAADLPEGPVQVGGDVKPPEKIFAPQPVYTELARKGRVQGVVIVQAIIDRQGNVTNIKVLRGLPMGLEEAAIQAIRRWKFKPATLNGRPVTVYYNLTVNFKL